MAGWTRSRRTLAVLAMLALVTVAGACGSDALAATPRRAAQRVAVVSTPHGGPLYPTVVGAGSRVVYLGGYTHPRRNRYVPVGTMRAYDTRSGTWHSLATAPFAPAPKDPGAVWTGTELIVLGNPCGVTSLEENEMNPARSCRNPTLRSGAWSASTNHWRTIRVPAAVRAKQNRALFNVSGLGWTGREALFTVVQGSTDPTPQHWLYNPRTHAWRRAPAPDAGAEVECFQGGALFAVRTGSLDPQTGAISSGASAATRVLSTWRLDTGARPRWIQLAPTPKPPDVQSDFVSCVGGNQLVYTVSFNSRSHPVPDESIGGDGALWFDARAGTWGPLPYLNLTGTAPGGAIVHGSRVLWTQSSQIVVLPAAAAAWLRSPAPFGPARPSESGVAGGRVFMNVRGNAGANRLVLVDPSAPAPK